MSRLPILSIRAAAVLAFFAGTTEAAEYCHREWSPEQGSHVVCSNYPDPAHDRGCRWEWSPSRGNYRICD